MKEYDIRRQALSLIVEVALAIVWILLCGLCASLFTGCARKSVQVQSSNSSYERNTEVHFMGEEQSQTEDLNISTSAHKWLSNVRIDALEILMTETIAGNSNQTTIRAKGVNSSREEESASESSSATLAEDHRNSVTVAQQEEAAQENAVEEKETRPASSGIKAAIIIVAGLIILLLTWSNVRLKKKQRL